MRLTRRDVDVLVAVQRHRVLRRDQIVRLLFPSKNTANERLKRLYQHRFLQRRWLAVEYGQGMGQALYLLDARGADLVAQSLGIDREGLRWRPSHNGVSLPFLEHTLLINDVRIAVALAAMCAGYQLECWVTEEELNARPDYVYVSGPKTRKRIAVIPDGYFVLHLGDRRAHLFLEADRATVSNKRWAARIRAYSEYVRSGQYTRRYGARSLRVLTVTTGPRRLANLKRTTEGAKGRGLFWFTTAEQAATDSILAEPIWQVAGTEGSFSLVA